MRKIISVILVLACGLALSGAALAAEPKPIGNNDFIIKIGKQSINMLTDSMDTIVKASGNKLASKKFWFGMNKIDGQVLKAKEATIDFDTYPIMVEFAKNTITTRGIKIGSTEKQLLEVYPEPSEKLVEKKNTYYLFEVMDANSMTEAEKANLVNARPASLYGVQVTVNNKTKKVTRLAFLARIELFP